MMKSYSVWPKASMGRFQEACAKVEKHIPELHNEGRLEDVDGSVIQVYTLNGRGLTVKNNYEDNAVYIRTEVDLEAILSKEALSDIQHRPKSNSAL